MGEPFIQRIKYEPAFMDQVLLKAQDFYFKKFLPAAVPHLIISLSDCNLYFSGPILNEHSGNTEVSKCDQQESSQDKNQHCPDRKTQ